MTYEMTVELHIENGGSSMVKQELMYHEAARPSLESILPDVADRPTRNECIYEASRIHGYTSKESGSHLGLYYSTISTIVRRVAEPIIPRKKTCPRTRVMDARAYRKNSLYFLGVVAILTTMLGDLKGACRSTGMLGWQ